MEIVNGVDGEFCGTLPFPASSYKPKESPGRSGRRREAQWENYWLQPKGHILDRENDDSYPAQRVRLKPAANQRPRHSAAPTPPAFHCHD